MKKITLLLLLFYNLFYSQTFISKSDTIKTNFDGDLRNAIKFKEKIYCFTETDNGGYSLPVTPLKYRPNYEGIKNYLKGKTPLSDLGCK